MVSVAQLIIFIIFIFNTAIAISFTYRFIRQPNPRSNTNITVLFILISSTVWSFGMGMMSMQSDDSYAYIWRSIGILGTFFFMASVQKFLCSISDIPVKVQRLLNIVADSGPLIFLLYITPGQTIFVHNSIGTTFYFKQGWINTIYSAYFFIVSINIFIVTLHMMKHHPLKRIRSAGKRLIIVESFIFIGAIFDMVMPSLGITAFPGSAITHFWGVMVFWSAIHEMHTSLLTVANMAEYIYYSLDTPVLIFNSDRTLEIYNDASIRFFNINNSEIKKQNVAIDQLFDTDGSFFDFEGKSSVKNVKCKNNNASCEVFISKIKNKFSDTIGYILLTNDLTEHEMVISKLEEAKLAADSANTTKSLFLANMSHELRTPLNAILGFSDLAMSCDNDPKQSADYISEIKNAGNVLLSLISGILDISKIELGKMELECSEYQTVTLFRDVEAIIRVNANKKNLIFNVNIDKDFPESLYGDSNKIREILINILNNSVKYTNDGFINLSAKISALKNDIATIKFEISDTGIGIKQEDIGSLFDKFHRLDSGLNSKVEGTGLGLSITKGLIELMDGTIEVESNYGIGSTFTVEINQKIINNNPINLNKNLNDISVSKETVSNSSKYEYKVLIVDDTAINLKVAASLLSKYYSIKSDTALSGMEALKKCSEKLYDIVFLDQMMPELDGIETLHRLREIPGYEESSSAKVVALTANAINGVKEQLLEEGFDYYLSKPIIKEELNTILSDISSK